MSPGIHIPDQFSTPPADRSSSGTSSTRESPIQSQTITPTPTPNFLPKFTLTNSPTIPANNTLMPTPTLQVILPEIQGDETQYILKKPSIETLIKLQLSRTSQLLYSNTPLDWLLYASFPDVLDFEWERTYSQHLFTPEIIGLIPNFYDHSRGRLTTNMLIDLIGEWVVYTLNHSQVHLYDQKTNTTGNFNLLPFQVEIDDDPTPEWVINVSDPGGYYLGEYTFWIAIEEIAAGDITRLEMQIPWQYGESNLASPKGYIGDLTGDGITDIAIIEEITNPSYTQMLAYINKGSESGFEAISSSINIFFDEFHSTTQVEYQWQKFPDNELPALVVTTSNKLLSWDCTIQSLQYYQWVGGQESVIETKTQIPDSSTCAIAQSFMEQSSNRNVAIQLLRHALDLANNLSPEYQVYILYRLALLSALSGDDSNAREFIDRIAVFSLKDNTKIATAIMKEIEPLLGEDIIYPYKLCLSAEAIALDIPANFFVNGALTPYAYPYQGFSKGYPEPLCDTRQIQITALSAIQFNPEKSPVPQLLEAGFPVKYASPIPVNKSTGWFVLIEDDNPDFLIDQPLELRDNDQLTCFRFTKEQGWMELLALEFTYDTITIDDKDVTGDGIPEINIVYPFLYQSDCGRDETPYSFFITTAIYKNWILSYNDPQRYICQSNDQPSNIFPFLVDLNNDGFSDWIIQNLEDQLYDVSLLGEISIQNHWLVHNLPASDLDSIINKRVIIHQLNKSFLSSNNSHELRSEIKSFRERWGSNDVFGININAQLGYLLALSYEIEGDENIAVEFFFDIWQNQPETIWAYLSASRLEYVAP
jgi:hypothetical protein